MGWPTKSYWRYRLDNGSVGGVKTISRLLAVLVAIPLAACSTASPPPPAAPSPPSSTSSAPAAWVAELSQLETRFGSRLGVYALNVSTGETVTQRADERFGMLSVFKGYACGALLKAHPLNTVYFSQRIRFTQADILPNSPVSSKNVGTGMTVSELCDAAITKSDNTAGNEILELLGGPTKVTEFARSIGDPVTRLDRTEPGLNDVPRGSEPDTTSPAAIAKAYQSMVLGEALAPDERAQIKSWLLATVTGDTRIRAGVPKAWVTADKTGTGPYGAANDVAITWPTPTTPIVIAVLSDKPTKGTDGDNALIAEATRVVASSLQP
jgi:beta-lactamase class A